MLTKSQKFCDFLFMVDFIGGKLNKSMNIAVNPSIQHHLRRRLNPQLTSACQSYIMIEELMDKGPDADTSFT